MYIKFGCVGYIGLDRELYDYLVFQLDVCFEIQLSQLH